MPQWKSIIVVLLLVQCFKESSSSFWPCESNDDCTAVGSECQTETSLCECVGFESVFSEDFTECLKTSLFGDTCEDTVQCNLMPTGANCKSGVCDCADGHTYVRGRCKPLNGLDQNCETDLDCYFGYDRESVKCENRLCKCADGYYHRHGNICRLKSMGIGDACVVNTDCADLGSDVQCKDLKCQVEETTDKPTTSTPNTTPSAETTEVTDTAETTLGTTESSSTQSTTTTTTTVVSTTESASSTITTSVTIETISTEAGSSATNTPTTETSYTENGSTHSKARKTEKSPTDFHADFTSRNLKNQEHLVLVNGGNSESSIDNDGDILSEIEVITHNAPPEENIVKSREIAVQTSIDAFELKDLTRKFRNVGTATASTSTSSRHTYSNRRRQTSLRLDDDEIKTLSTYSNTDDEGGDAKYGGACVDIGKQCPNLPHSLCTNKICFCKQGYYPNNGKCFAELGEIAESEDDCEFEFQKPTKKCICQKNYFYERSLRSCRKPIQYHLSCTSNSQCSPFGAAYCHPTIPRRCKCEQFAEYDAYKQMCIYKQGLGSECDRNEGCPTKNSVCTNKTCVCAEKFVEKDGACLAGVGADCEDDNTCAVENSACEVKIAMPNDEEMKRCQCRKGYVHFKDECLKEAEEIEDECIDTEQCKPLLATCDNKKCKCKDEQQLKNGKCESKKELGEACKKATECHVDKDPETVECRNSVCQCKFGYQTDGQNRNCIRVVPNKKNSSGRPSALKIITFMLIGAAFLVTSAAIKQAYFF